MDEEKELEPKRTPEILMSLIRQQKLIKKANQNTPKLNTCKAKQPTS
jgi:hypothetical protein